MQVIKYNMDLIKLYDNSLTFELCELIIHLFENSDSKVEGKIHSGLNKDFKITTDLNIINRGKEWGFINKILLKEIAEKLPQYYKDINTEESPGKFVFYSEYYNLNTFNIQKYQKNQGHYKFHDDTGVLKEDNSSRILTYLWYLNDVEKGGETEFYNGLKIKPKQGTLLLFPSTWTYLHRGCVPVSNDKYIVTGWVYAKVGVI